MKTCTKCKEAKDLSEFYNSSTSKDGKQSRCGHCSNEASKWSQGMKREAKRELKAILDTGELGYRIAMQAEDMRHEKNRKAIMIKYHKNVAKLADDHTCEDMKHGQTV